MRKLSGGNFFPQGFFPLVIQVLDLREALGYHQACGMCYSHQQRDSRHQAGKNEEM